MRSRLGRRTARLAHAAAHDGHGQTGCHVVQPGSRRSSQRSDCQRDRRIRRPNGPYHRPHDHSVPDAQPVEGCGNVEPPGAMRQNPFFGGVASHARKHLEPLYLAGRRDRTAVRPGSGNKRGRRTICPTKPQRRSIPRPARFLRQPNRMRIQIRHSEMHRRPPENSPSGAFGPAWASNFPAGKSYSPPAHSSEE